MPAAITAGTIQFRIRMMWCCSENSCWGNYYRPFFNMCGPQSASKFRSKLDSFMRG